MCVWEGWGGGGGKVLSELIRKIADQLPWKWEGGGEERKL